MPYTDANTGLTRMTTRSKNATTHPGIMAQDVLRTHRKKEEVEKEKELKTAKKEANRKKKADDKARQVAGEAYIAGLKVKEATATEKMEEVPRK
jgi:hypothetical protein